MSQQKLPVFSMNDRLLGILQKYSLTESNYSTLVQLPYYARKADCKQEGVGKSCNASRTQIEERRKMDEYVYVNEKDKLFWYLMMIVNNWEISDLPDHKERFYYERDEKTKAVELLQKSTDIHWKELKLAKTDICTNLACGSRRPVTLSEFVALCYLYEKNVLIHWGKCYYKIHGGLAGPDQTWYIIVRTKSGEKLVSDAASKIFYERIVSSCFKVKSLDKKLAPEASYKLDDLEQIATKLGISILRDDGKKMRKKEIYSLLQTETEKID